MTGQQLGCGPMACLLYTSDAADDTPCVDLGGRLACATPSLGGIVLACAATRGDVDCAGALD